MRKIFLHLPLLLFSLNGFCQELNRDSSNVRKVKHDISLSYGILTNNRFTKDDPGIWNIDYLRYTNGLFLTYKYSIIQRLSICCSLGYEAISKNFYDHRGNYLAHVNSEMFTTAIEIEFKHINSEKMQLYSSLGFGNTHTRNWYIDPAPLSINEFNFQIVLFGFRGGGRFSPSFGIGWGYRGFVNIGLSYQF